MKATEDRRRALVWLPLELHRKLKLAAKAHGMTVEGAAREWFGPVVERKHSKAVKAGRA
jgi:plasmid stability protein